MVKTKLTIMIFILQRCHQIVQFPTQMNQRYFRLRKQDWKQVQVYKINTSTPCWNGNKHVHSISALIAHMKLVLWQQAYLNAS